MVKYVSVIYRLPGLDRQQVADYWLNVHSPLIKRVLKPYLRKYVINIAAQRPGSPEPEHDGIVELYFDDMAALHEALSGPGWNSEERKASSNKFIDYTRIHGYYVEEHVIPVEA